MVKLAIYGTGNTAWTLSDAFLRSNQPVHAIVARDPKGGRELAKLRNSEFVDPQTLNCDDYDILILAITDSSISEVASGLKGNKAILAHTSGPSSINELSSYSGEKAVFYPLQTMTKGGTTPFDQVPILTEASSKGALHSISELAHCLSKDVRIMTSDRRLALHVSAVFYNNFVNHINAMAEGIAAQYQVPFDLLMPLISKTADLAKDQASSENQTGPAVRNDLDTIEKHLDLLSEDEKTIYQILTASIQKKNETKL